MADVDRVIRIFDALLRLAEIDAGMRRSGFVTFDLVDLAGDRGGVLRAGGGAQEHPAAIACGRRRCSVSGDPVLLAQALSNLIDNALKYTPENGTIDVTVRRRADGRAEIAVTDNGPGIDDSEKTKVVERFYRGDASRGTPGVGLGLSLAQAVAKLHGSALELSDRGPGLSVVLTMALCEEPPARSRNRVRPQSRNIRVRERIEITRVTRRPHPRDARRRTSAHRADSSDRC